MDAAALRRRERPNPHRQGIARTGALVNAKAKGGATPLHEAARNGHRATIEALLAGGAYVNAKTKDGSTPADYARRGMETTEGSIAPFQEAIELLKTHGGRLTC